MTGILYGVGVGPGDPELMTLKALRLIRACPVLAWPAPEEGESFARSIVAAHLADLPPKTEVAIRMPMTVERFPAQAVYDTAQAVLRAHLCAGQDVAVLCQGDPFFYGSFMYLFARLAHDHPIQIIPGVSALTACAAAASHPLISRTDSLVVLPGTLPASELRERLLLAEAAAILKLGRHAGTVRAVLSELGLLEDAVLVVRASLPDQQVIPFAEAVLTEIPYFATVLVHRRGNAVR